MYHLRNANTFETKPIDYFELNLLNKIYQKGNKCGKIFNK